MIPATRAGWICWDGSALMLASTRGAIFKRSKGGVTPGGWSCEHLPYLVEFDNFGRSNPGKPSKSPFIWGWDEITWYALLPEQERNDWLRYAWKWVKDNDSN